MTRAVRRYRSIWVSASVTPLGNLMALVIGLMACVFPPTTAIRSSTPSTAVAATLTPTPTFTPSPSNRLASQVSRTPLLSPAVGALLMSLSIVIVAINAQLLRRHRVAVA